MPRQRRGHCAACLAFPADGPNTFQTEGRAVDGRLAGLDADHDDRRARNTHELNVFQIMEVRSILSLFILYPLIRANGGLAAMKTSRPLQHLGRNLIHYAAQLCWFFALTLIPIAQVCRSSSPCPIWTAILAASFLGERITVWKITAIVLGVVASS